MKKIPFSKNELKIVGQFPTFECLRDRVPNEPKRNTPITSRENFLAAFRRELPLWMPTRSDTFTFIPKVIIENRARALVYDAEPFQKKRVAKTFLEWIGNMSLLSMAV